MGVTPDDGDATVVRSPDGRRKIHPDARLTGSKLDFRFRKQKTLR
jgi:hypothetical protein